MRAMAMMSLLFAFSSASMHTRGSQQTTKLHMHKAVAKEEPAAPEGTAKAPEQGFEGKDVQHVDMDTATGDWRREYGPKGPPNHPAAEMKSSALSMGALSGFATALCLATVFV